METLGYPEQAKLSNVNTGDTGIMGFYPKGHAVFKFAESLREEGRIDSAETWGRAINTTVILIKCNAEDDGTDLGGWLMPSGVYASLQSANRVTTKMLDLFGRRTSLEFSEDDELFSVGRKEREAHRKVKESINEHGDVPLLFGETKDEYEKRLYTKERPWLDWMYDDART